MASTHPASSSTPARSFSSVISKFPWYTRKVLNDPELEYEPSKPAAHSSNDDDSPKYAAHFRALFEHIRHFEQEMYSQCLNKQLARYRRSIGFTEESVESSKALVPVSHPKVDEKQAPTVCAILAMYRLSEVPDLLNGSQKLSATPYPRIHLPKPRLPGWDDLENWPSVVLHAEEVFTKKLGQTQIPQPPSGSTDHPSIHLLKVLSQLNAHDRVTKITLNFVLAALHLAPMFKSRSETSNAASFNPQSLFLELTRSSILLENGESLQADEANLSEFLQTEYCSAHSARLPVLVALLISPICLLLASKLAQKNSWSRQELYETARALGNEKPEELLHAELKVMELLIRIATERMELHAIVQAIKNMLSALPLSDLRNLAASDPVRFWFRPGPASARFESGKASQIDSNFGARDVRTNIDPKVCLTASPAYQELNDMPPALITGSTLPPSPLEAPVSSPRNLQVGHTGVMRSSGVQGRGDDDFSDHHFTSLNQHSEGGSPAPAVLVLEVFALADMPDPIVVPSSGEYPIAISSLTSPGHEEGDQPILLNEIPEVAMTMDRPDNEKEISAHEHDSEGGEHEDGEGGNDIGCGNGTDIHPVRDSDPESEDQEEFEEVEGEVGTVNAGQEDGQQSTGEGSKERDEVKGQVQVVNTHADRDQATKKDAKAPSSQSTSHSSRSRDKDKKRKKEDHGERSNKKQKLDDKKTTSRRITPSQSHSARTQYDKHTKAPIEKPRPVTSIDHEVHPVEQSEYWLPFTVDPFEPEKNVNLNISKPSQPTLKGEAVVAYGSHASDELKFVPRFHDNKTLVQFAAIQKAVENSWVDGKPLHIQNPEKSVFKIMTEEEFFACSPTRIQDILRSRCICVTNRTGRPLEFSERGLSTLGALHKVVTIQDLSIPISSNGNLRRREGTMYQILECSRQEDGKILNALQFPRPRTGYDYDLSSHISTEAFAWTSTEGSIDCKEGLELPISDMRWGLVAIDGAIHLIHIDSDGLGTYIDPKTGAKYWIILRPKAKNDLARPGFFFDASFDLDNPSLFYAEAILLRPGTTLIMPPSMPHAVYTPMNAICWGGHYYSTGTMQSTLYGIVHAFMAGNYITNTSHPTSRILLRRIVCFYHQALVEGVVKTTDTLYEHIPRLDNVDSALDLLSLCTLMYLGNALEFQTYQFPTRLDGERWTDAETNMWFKDDLNSVPKVDRKRWTYARGLARNLIRWFIDNHEITSNSSKSSTRGWKKISTRDFALDFIANRFVAIKNYAEHVLKRKYSASELKNCTYKMFAHQIDGCFSLDDPLRSYKERVDTTKAQVSMGFSEDEKRSFRIVKAEKLKGRPVLSYQELATLGTSQRDVAYYAHLAEKETARWVKLEDM